MVPGVPRSGIGVTPLKALKKLISFSDLSLWEASFSQQFNKGFKICFVRRSPASPAAEMVAGADGVAASAGDRTQAYHPHVEYTGIKPLFAFNTHRILGKLRF